MSLTEKQSGPGHWISALGALILFSIGLVPDVHAQEIRVHDVQARQSGNTIVITYALEGDSDVEYQVDLKVSDDNGRSFSIEPDAVSGDVGEAIRPGREKQIVWNVLNDFPGGVEGKGYKFRVTARKQPSDTQVEESPQVKYSIGMSIGASRGDLNGHNIGGNFRVNPNSWPLLFAVSAHINDLDVIYNSYSSELYALTGFGLDDLIFTPYLGAGLYVGILSDYSQNRVTVYGANIVGGGRFTLGRIELFVEVDAPFENLRHHGFEGGILFSF